MWLHTDLSFHSQQNLLQSRQFYFALLYLFLYFVCGLFFKLKWYPHNLIMMKYAVQWHLEHPWCCAPLPLPDTWTPPSLQSKTSYSLNRFSSAVLSSRFLHLGHCSLWSSFCSVVWVWGPTLFFRMYTSAVSALFVEDDFLLHWWTWYLCQKPTGHTTGGQSGDCLAFPSSLPQYSVQGQLVSYRGHSLLPDFIY